MKGVVPFTNVEVCFRSGTVNVYDGVGNKVNTEKSTGFHKVVFENERESDDFRNNLGISFKGMINAVVDPIASITKVHIGSKYKWKIVDIDSFLSGNPHLSR